MEEGLSRITCQDQIYILKNTFLAVWPFTLGKKNSLMLLQENNPVV